MMSYGSDQSKGCDRSAGPRLWVSRQGVASASLCSTSTRNRHLDLFANRTRNVSEELAESPATSPHPAIVSYASAQCTGQITRFVYLRNLHRRQGLGDLRAARRCAASRVNIPR